jgi:hypothetical protein
MASTSAAERFVAFFRSLRDTKDVDERLVRLGLAERGEGGDIALREDIRGPFETLVARLRASLDAGATPREAVEATAIDVDLREVTHVVYGLFQRAGGPELYVGETVQTAAARFAAHPKGCPKLAAWIEETGGKVGWTCAVLIVLPGDARSKELLLYLEARLQRLLDTVDGAHGLNCHYGAGTYGGAVDEERWISKYVEFIEFATEHGRMPSHGSADAHEKTLGNWAKVQRQKREGMSTHRRKALEALKSAWQWSIISPRMSNAVLFEKLRSDDRVTSTEGVCIPTDIVGSMRVNNARKRFASGAMPTADREIVVDEFPGLAMSSSDASFLLSVKAFSDAHPDASTLPSCMSETKLYRWLANLRIGMISMTDWRENIMRNHGLDGLLNTLDPIDKRFDTVSKRKMRTIERTADISEACEKARDAKRCKMIDDLTAAPDASV